MNVGNGISVQTGDFRFDNWRGQRMRLLTSGSSVKLRQSTGECHGGNDTEDGE